MANYVSYQGNGVYQVQLYNGSRWVGMSVNFEGLASTHGADAQVKVGVTGANVSADIATCEGEFWVTLMQRAMLSYHGIDYTSASACTNSASIGPRQGTAGKWAKDGFALLGQPAGDSWVLANWFTGVDDNSLRKIESALGAGKAVTAAFDGGSSNLVKGFHEYEVIGVRNMQDVNNATIVLRNPWGRDGGTIVGVDDGYVTLTAKEFSKLCKNLTITYWAVR